MWIAVLLYQPHRSNLRRKWKVPYPAELKNQAQYGGRGKARQI